MTDALSAVLQQPIRDVSQSHWDVIIVGAGPAGAAAAVSLSTRPGLKILLVDRTRFPREKVCGDALVPESMRALEQLGLAAQVRKHSSSLPGYRLISPSGFSVSLKSPVTLMERKDFDALLAGKAVANGVAFAQGEFENAIPRTDGEVDCTFDGKTFQTSVLLLACGSDLGPVRALGFASGSIKPEGVAIRRYYRSTSGPDRPCFFLQEDFLPGYAWIFPMGNNYYNVGCGRFLGTNKKFKSSLSGAFEQFLRDDETAKNMVTNATEVTPIRGSSLRCGMPTTDNAQRGRMLLAGEAIGTTIPGWGEGISKAMETGLLAATVIRSAFDEKDFSKLMDYPRRLAVQIKPDIEKHTRITWFFNRPWTANLLVAAARAMPGNWFQH